MRNGDGSVVVSTSITGFDGPGPVPGPLPNPNPDPAGPVCLRAARSVGLVEVCADRFEGSGSDVRALGDVRLNSGLSVGDGPIVLDAAADQVRSLGRVPLALVRADGRRPLGSAEVIADGTAATDSISGRERLSPLVLRSWGPTSLALAGAGLLPRENAYLDKAEGGGIVFAAQPSFDLLRWPLTGSFAIGAHAGALTAIRVLGGSAGWNGLKVRNWKLTADVAYLRERDQWTVKGNAEFPDVFKKVAGIGISGALRKGKIDELGVEAKTTGIPLGSSGFVLDKFTGKLAGLAGGPGNPIRITIGTAGGWPAIAALNIPKLGAKRILNLDSAEVSVATDLSGEIKGSISLVDPRLAKGDLRFAMALDPFKASGSLSAGVVKVLGTGWDLRTQTDMTSRNFTGTGEARFKLVGRTVGRAAGILSDAGTGVTGLLCLPFQGCNVVGVGIRWADAAHLPPRPEFIGADINRYRTVKASAARTGGATRIPVGAGNVLLAVSANSPRGIENLELVSPSGKRHSLASAGSLANAERAPDGREAIIIVGAPERGPWTVRAKGKGPVQTEVQRVPALRRLRVRSLKPATTRRRRLGRRMLEIRWSPRGLPKGARVQVLTSNRAGRTGRPIAAAAASSSRGTLKLRASKLTRGANHLALIVLARKIPYQTVLVKRPVWR